MIMSNEISVHDEEGKEITEEDYKSLKETMEQDTKEDTCENFTTFINDIKNHTCKNKELESSDLPIILHIGYTCKGCGKRFFVSLKNMKEDPLYAAFKNHLNNAKGRTQLGKLLNFKPGSGVVC